MSSPFNLTNSEVITNADRIIPIADQQTSGGFGSFMEGFQNNINQKVEQHIRNGDFVLPAGQPESVADRAAGLTDRAASQESLPGFPGLFGYSRLNDDGIINRGPGMNEYVRKVKDACNPIDNQEQTLAQRQYDALSPSEKQELNQDRAALKAHEMQMIYHYNDAPPDTPHLRAFNETLKASIAPLERERATTINKVWHDLPVETKASIFRAQEQAIAIKGL